MAIIKFTRTQRRLQQYKDDFSRDWQATTVGGTLSPWEPAYVFTGSNWTTASIASARCYRQQTTMHTSQPRPYHPRAILVRWQLFWYFEHQWSEQVLHCIATIDMPANHWKQSDTVRWYRCVAWLHLEPGHARKATYHPRSWDCN